MANKTNKYRYYPVYTTPPEGITLEEWRFILLQAAAKNQKSQTEYISEQLAADPVIASIIREVKDKKAEGASA